MRGVDLANSTGRARRLRARRGARSQRTELLFQCGRHPSRSRRLRVRAVDAGKGSRADPADAEIALRYADACYRSLRNAAAVSALADWRSLASLRPHVLSEIAQLLINLGLQLEGEQALETALVHPDADAVTFLTGIEIAERINRLDQAQALLARLESEAHPAAIDQDLVIIRARLAQRTGDHAAAERLYRQALLVNADSARRHMELFPLVQSLDAQGRYAELWRRCRKRTPRNMNICAAFHRSWPSPGPRP